VARNSPGALVSVGYNAANMRISRTKTAAAGLLIACYFLLLTRDGWKSYFDADSLLNIAYLHGYGRVPLGMMAVQALTVFTPEYRPMGGLYYRTLFAVFGLDPLAFRIAAFLLLGLNLALAWRWARELSGSRFTAAASTLLFAFHPALSALYYGDGTIYDVLCLSFLLAALTRYVRIRRQEGFLGIRDLLVVMAFFGAALGSKEMALTFPGVLIVYEGLFHSHFRSLGRRATPIVILGIMTALCMGWKTFAPNPMSSNIGQAYTPRFDLTFIGREYLHYYQQLVLDPSLGGTALCVGLLIALAAAAAMRNRVMLFGLLFANLALLPVCVIPGRGGFVWYIPMLGWALYGGSALWQLGSALAALVRTPAYWQAALLGVVAIAAYWFQAPRAAELGAPYIEEQQPLRSLMTAARSASPRLPAGARILLEGDPADVTSLIPLFLLRLGYRDARLWVEPVAQLPENDSPAEASLYAMTIRRAGSGYRVATYPQTGATPVQVATSPGVVHRGQTVRAEFPASLAGCEIDVAYNMPEDELLRAGVWSSWVKLDVQGGGVAQVGRDAERGLVVIDHVRGCKGDWMPARGSFVIIP